MDEGPVGSGESPNSGQVLDSLLKILDTSVFRNSNKLSYLLSYLVNQTLQGQSRTLKEYTIGVDVYDRGADFNPRTDAIVRVEVSRLRSRLDEYYAQEGKNDRVRISIPKGGYKPVFTETETHAHQPPTPPVRAVERVPRENVSIAVLPFQLMGTCPTQKLMLDGFSYHLVSELSKFPELSVSSSLSTLPFQFSGKDASAIAEELGTSHLLTGSAIAMDDKLRLTVELAEGHRGRIIWSERFQTETAEFMHFQEKILPAITGMVAVRLGFRTPSGGVQLRVVGGERRAMQRRSGD